MLNGNTHKMELGSTRPDGSQEWFCLQCGHKVLVKWEPVFKLITIETGEETAIHTGSLGGAGLELTNAKTVAEPEMPVMNGKDILH